VEASVQLHVLAALRRGKNLDKQIEGLVDPTVHLHVLGKKKKSVALTGIQTPDRPTSSYIDRPAPAPY
jgi:hypothetical protein